MSDPSIGEADPSSDLISLFAETAWPTAILAASAQVLALNRPMCELLGVGEAAVVGKPVDALALAQDRARVRSLVEQAADGRSSAPVGAHLLRPGQAPLRVELEAIAVPDDLAPRVALIVHPISLAHRREQLILELNRLAPALMVAQSPDDVFRRAAQSLEPLGLGMAIWLVNPERAALRLHYAALSAAIVDYLTHVAGMPIASCHISQTTPGYHQVLSERRAVFWNDFESLLRHIMRAPAAAICRTVLRLLGIRGLVLAPILISERTSGVLLVWSCVLNREDTPFVEALAHQIAAVLLQIELRQRTASQIQRLDSLAATAQAVTTLASLEDVLRVICLQAQDLLGAEHVAVALPEDGTDSTVCVMATGRSAAAIIGMRMPNASSLVGQVFTSGRGMWSADVSEEQQAFQPATLASSSRSALFQPLRHSGRVLGVLIVNHSQPGRFSQADLDYLARYAEYAAVAVANARLHTALQQSEAEQRRQRLELAALLRVNETVNRSLDLDTILQEGLRSLDNLCLVMMAGVLLIDQAGTFLEMRAQLRVPPMLIKLFSRLPLANLAVVQKALRTGEVQVLGHDQIREFHAIYPGLETVPLGSSIFIPLIADGKPLGTLNIGHTDEQPYTERELRLLRAIADQLAQAVVRAQNHRAIAAAAAANARLYYEAEGIRSYLNTLIRHTPDALLTIGQNMTIHALNPERLAAATGYRPEQVDGRPFLEFVPERLHADLLASWRKIVSGQPQTLETEIIAADGASLAAILSAALIPEYGEVFVIIKDVTEQKRLEAQLHQSEKLAALGRLVAGVAHELNNPLAVILGLAQLQLMGDLPPAIREDIENIERAARRASRIVQQLRTFAQPQQAESRSLDLARLIDETLSRLAPQISAQSVAVAVDLPGDLPRLVADVHQLEQVLFNILHNAVLAMALNLPGAPRVLSVRCRVAGSEVRLEVGDSGPGIAPEHMSRIFDPFFTTRRVGEGTGLGLSIVHAIVRQHGGRIWVESVRGKGATFYVELPIGAESDQQQPPVAPRAPAWTMPDARILLVEDEDAVRAVTVRALARLGYQVDAVANGVAALEQALARDYALIVSDLQMPGMDGATLYQELRARRPALRWLILTGDTMAEQSSVFLEQTGLPVLPKPFTHEQLAARVAESLATGADGG